MLPHLILAVLCAQPQDTPAPPTDEKPKLAEKDELPTLRGILLQPRANAESFDTSSPFYVMYPKEGVAKVSRGRASTKKEALALARKWLDEHFAPSADSDFILKPDPPTAANDPDGADSQPGKAPFEFRFRSTYRGIMTTSHISITVDQDGHVSALSMLRAFSELPGTAKRILSSDKAVGIWKEISTKRGDNTIENAEPTLIYHMSPWLTLTPLEDFILATTWSMDAGDVRLVDGHSGRPWVDD